MKAKGYEYDANHNHCGISDAPLFEQWRNLIAASIAPAATNSRRI
jgi:hypothetical protein